MLASLQSRFSQATSIVVRRNTLATLSSRAPSATVQLKNGQSFRGQSFGAPVSSSGEVVFTTSLVGYPESMTDPSYRGQILTFTQPLIGNYGVPAPTVDRYGLMKDFESEKIQVAGIIVADYAQQYSHWNAVQSLAQWCESQGVPAITGVDTRALTQLLRDQGSTLGKLVVEGSASVDYQDPGARNLVAEASTKTIRVFNQGGQYKVALIDCGVKHNIIRCLADRGAEVHLVPYDYDVSVRPDFDGIFISNGPGNPIHCTKTVATIRKLLLQNRPIFGICMGNLLLGSALDVPTYKLQFGNRSHNQPALNHISNKGVITSQNHGYALDIEKLPADWLVYFSNLNDGSNEGIRHRYKPFKSVQFHPEAKGGPEDTLGLFDEFLDDIRMYVATVKKQSVTVGGAPKKHQAGRRVSPAKEAEQPEEKIKIAASA